jgi:hypothetical protein
MLLNSTHILEIIKVGVTKKNSIYLVYTTKQGKGCSFVSLAELRAALGVENSDRYIVAKLAITRTQDLITYNRSFFPDHTFIRRKIEQAVNQKNLTAVFVEEDGELFARIYYFHQFLGIIHIDHEGKISLITDRFKGKHCFSIAGAIGLIADSLPRKRSTLAEMAERDRTIFKRGMIANPDGTVSIDHEFYRLMGKVSQVRGRR